MTEEAKELIDLRVENKLKDQKIKELEEAGRRLGMATTFMAPKGFITRGTPDSKEWRIFDYAGQCVVCKSPNPLVPCVFSSFEEAEKFLIAS